MNKNDIETLAAQLLHHRAATLAPGDSVVPAIFPAAVFHLPGNPSNAPFVYGRYSNPTWEALEAALSLLEGAETLIFPSGMAAIGAVLFTTVRAGDRILLPADGYFTARVLADQYLKGFGVQVDTRPTPRFLEGGFDGYRLVHIETPTNPALDVCDLRAAAELAKAAGATLSVDNTTMTALGQRPLELGADIVVCAGTKAVNGHSDTLLGHVALRHGEVMTRLMEWRKASGTIASPFDAWLVYRGLETLELRFARMCASAAVIAERLQGHECVLAVRFPGLKNDPAHAVAARQMATFGSMISLTLRDTAAAERFIAECPYIQAATSFGGVRTSAERRARWGDSVAEGFVRMSIGIEPVEPLWKAIDSALRKSS